MWSMSVCVHMSAVYTADLPSPQQPWGLMNPVWLSERALNPCHNMMQWCINGSCNFRNLRWTSSSSDMKVFHTGFERENCLAWFERHRIRQSHSSPQVEKSGMTRNDETSRDTVLYVRVQQRRDSMAGYDIEDGALSCQSKENQKRHDAGSVAVNAKRFKPQVSQDLKKDDRMNRINYNFWWDENHWQQRAVEACTTKWYWFDCTGYDRACFSSPQFLGLNEHMLSG